MCNIDQAGQNPSVAVGRTRETLFLIEELLATDGSCGERVTAFFRDGLVGGPPPMHTQAAPTGLRPFLLKKFKLRVKSGEDHIMLMDEIFKQANKCKRTQRTQCHDFTVAQFSSSSLSPHTCEEQIVDIAVLCRAGHSFT